MSEIELRTDDVADLPVPNLPLLRKVLDHIDAHPDEWNQRKWGVQTARSSCGTAFCVAGHALLMSGYVATPCPNGWGDLDFTRPDGSPVSVDAISREARDVLGLEVDESMRLFGMSNNRHDVQRYAEAIAARAGERL